MINSGGWVGKVFVAALAAVFVFSITPLLFGAEASSEADLGWHRFTPLDDSLSVFRAANPASGFQARFTGEGLIILPGSGNEDSWEFLLQLEGYGRPGEVQPADSNAII